MPDSLENQRQTDLMAAILSFEPALPCGWQAPAHVTHPLYAHQGHVRVLSARLLAQTYPTLLPLLPLEVWPQLAQAFWQQHPPEVGNLQLWGGALPTWLSTAAWQNWPFLADVAQLDWAIHESLMASAAEPEPHTLSLLGEDTAKADTLCIELRPDVRLVHGHWPMVSIYGQVHGKTTELQPGLLETPRPEWACLIGTDVHAVAEDWWAFMRALQPLADGTAPINLQTVLTLQTSRFPTFDFTAWLTAALTHGWFWRVRNLSV